MKQWASVIVTISIILSACNNTVTATDPNLNTSKNNSDKKKSDEGLTKEDESKPQLLNDISIETEGEVEVYRTFLTYESDDLVPSSNVTSVGKPIYLNLNITKGWKEEAGQVFLGASEKISTDDGTVLLNEPDLFLDQKSISADDAKFIKLKAVVNKISAPIKYFIVDYKVWDKNSNSVIKGSYKFYVK